jgi:hypothetical protein
MRRAILGALWVMSAVVACSSSGDENGGAGAGAAGSGPIFIGGNGNGTGADGGPLGGSGLGAGCANSSVATEAAPLDIYVMFDRSCSMSCPAEQGGPGLCCIGGPNPRIDQVRNAMTQFLNHPESAGISVGIGYFGYMQIGQASCNPQDYSRADVPIGPLPQNTPALENSLRGAQPTGETPTGAAIRGACAYSTQWKAQNPGRSVVILLVTDGMPEAPSSGPRCVPTLQDAQAAAEECLTQQSVPTYVLGVGANLDNLQAIARSGGTTQAYLTDGAADVTGTILNALNTIRDTAKVPCKFKIPPPPAGQTLNPAEVNVTYDDATGAAHIVPGAGAATNCGPTGGWFYDNAQNPTTVELCPTSCDEVTASLVAGAVLGRPAHISLVFGCGTITNIH